MFLGKDVYERTDWHIAFEKGQLEVLQKMWEWAENVLTPEYLKCIFLGKDGYERATWHLASWNV